LEQELAPDARPGERVVQNVEERAVPSIQLGLINFIAPL
jgi:hypothetical protein